MSNKAWVTLATNDSYGLGALVLAHSLRRAGSIYPAAVLITPSVTEAMRERLRAVFAEVISVDVLDSRDAAHLALLQRPELGITFTKIHCWGLTQYEKCVFLDADTLVVQNCDELFEREELSAAPDVGWPDCFNSGVFVYKPSQETLEQLIKFAQERGSFDGGDQGLLNSFFSDWAQGDSNKRLPFLYNVTSAAFYSYLPALKHYGQNLKIIHFIGATKPWLQQFNWESRSVDAPEHLREFLQIWWDLFVGQVHPQLDVTMSGVAGNLARVVPGEVSTQREAIDELTRRQGWEAGNIDYMGADSFDNIWAKISQTLSQPRQSPPKQTKQPSPPKEQSPPKEAVEVAQEATVVDAASTQTVPEAPAAVEPLVAAVDTKETEAVNTVTTVAVVEAAAKVKAPVPVEAAPVSAEAIPLPAPAETETAPVATETVPALTESAPAPTESAPVPTESAPAPTESAPVPTESAPVPTEIAPAQAEVVPKPVEAAPVSSEAPPAVTSPVEAASVPVEVKPASTEAVSLQSAETPQVEASPTEPPAPKASKAPVEVPAATEPKSEIPVTPQAPSETSTTVESSPVEPPREEKTETEPTLPLTPPVSPKSPQKPVESKPKVEAAKEPSSKPAKPEATPEKPSEPSGCTDSPPLANTPSKDEVPKLPAAKSEGRKGGCKLQLKPPAVADPLPTPDSEVEDAATLATSIIASELKTPTVTSPTSEPEPVSPPAKLQTQRLSVDEPEVPTPPVGAVSLAQIGVKAKAKSSTAAQIESSVTEKASNEPATPTDAPKKKIVKKVLKKDKEASTAAAGADAPVPPPRKKEKKPKEK